MNLSYSHIIALVVVCILLTGAYIIARVHLGGDPRVKGGDDFITQFLNIKREELKKAGGKFSLTAYLVLLLLCPLAVGIAVYVLSGNAVSSVLLGIISVMIPKLIVKFTGGVHVKHFEERYSRSLEQLAASLRAGMSILQAVEEVASCTFIHESVRKHYVKMANDMRFGISVSEAFRGFAEDSGSADAEDVAIAVEVQDKIGGHEAETIYEAAMNIHDRIMLRKEIHTIFSQTSSMIYIMDFLAPACMGFFAIASPDYLDTYFTSPLYVVILIILVLMPFAGIIVTSSMLKKVRTGQ